MISMQPDPMTPPTQAGAEYSTNRNRGEQPHPLRHSHRIHSGREREDVAPMSTSCKSINAKVYPETPPCKSTLCFEVSRCSRIRSGANRRPFPPSAPTIRRARVALLPSQAQAPPFDMAKCGRVYQFLDAIRKISTWRNASSKESDLEMQSRGPDSCDKETPLWSAALEAFFCLTRDELVKFPSIGAYCRHVESQFSPIFGPSYDTLWGSLHPTLPTASPAEPADCWRLLHAVAVALQTVSADTSLEDLKNSVIPATTHTDTRTEPHVSVAVFAAICWLTMMLHPSLSFEAPGSTPSLACIFQGTVDGPVHQRLHIREAKRPISRLISAFKGNVWPINPAPRAAKVTRTITCMKAV